MARTTTPENFSNTSRSVYSGFFSCRGSRKQTLSHNPLNTSISFTSTTTTIETIARYGDNVIADVNSTTGTVLRTYVTPILDQNVSMTAHDGQTDTTFYYNADERQSVMNLTDSTGAVAASYGYSAYGDPISQLRSHVSSLSLQNRYTYTGRESSDVSSDYYFRYRWYGAASGGFFGRDPLGFVDGMSMYAGYFAARSSRDPYGTTGVFFMGTGMPLSANTNIRKLYDAYTENAYITTIGLVSTGASRALTSAHRHICKKVCANVTVDKENCTHDYDPIDIDIFGYSRGAMNAVRLAKDLKENGCNCITVYPDGKKLLSEIKPVDVRFLGLIDVIERGYYNFKKDVITNNVKNAFHAYRDGKHDDPDILSWDTLVGKPIRIQPEDKSSTNFKEKAFPYTHPGMGWNQPVYDAMVKAAKAAGVPL